MDLGDEGAARAIDLLGPQDAVAVFAGGHRAARGRPADPAGQATAPG